MSKLPYHHVHSPGQDRAGHGLKGVGVHVLCVVQIAALVVLGSLELEAECVAAETHVLEPDSLDVDAAATQVPLQHLPAPQKDVSVGDGLASHKHVCAGRQARRVVLRHL